MTALFRTFTDRPLRLVAVTLVLAIAGGLALTADAAPPRGGAHEGAIGDMMVGPGHIQHMLDAVNASTEQRSQIKAIMDGAQVDLKAQREASRSLHEQSLQLFTQSTVDARAAETLRQQMLAQHDVASKRMLQAMLDVSRVLTADQRKQLGDSMVQRRAQMERQRAEREASGKSATQ